MVGLECGDEAKGRVLDNLVSSYDCSGRYSGGDNAGHTIAIDGMVYKLHIAPAGMLTPGVYNIIGNGVLVNPETLVDKELKVLEADGYFKRPNDSEEGNLLISDIAHTIMPWHRALDEAKEIYRGAKEIGTTKRGIGPVNEDKVGRSEAIRIMDFMDEDLFEEMVRRIYPLKKEIINVYTKSQDLTEKTLKKYGGSSIDEILENYGVYREYLEGLVGDSEKKFKEFIIDGKHILLEGAQGTGLSVNFGTYPNVTSTEPTVLGVPTGTGIDGRLIDNVVGVSKAYITRVGSGPLPTELFDYIGKRIRDVGGEYGTTTGRPRRVGWKDIPILRFSNEKNNSDYHVISKIDVLDGFDEVKICVAYDINGTEVNVFDPKNKEMEHAVPVYETFDGWNIERKVWKEHVNGGTLPRQVEPFFDKIVDELGVPLLAVSFSPERNDVVFLEDPEKLLYLDSDE